MKIQKQARLDLVGLSLLALSCSGTDDGGSDPESGSGGWTAAGGNASTGGTSSGGASTAGAATGGAPTGGASGGSLTGGEASGGATTGGAATGGESSTGGAGSGGDPGGTGGAQSDGPPYALGNPAVPSAGCNQSTTLSTGTHQMTSADLDREYILELPEGYDSSKPYRLVFGMHWFGGSAEAVQGWSEWFNLKPLDTEHTTIFVAPQGYTNGSPWRGGDDKDHTFFEELYETITSDLCVDTSRVFSLGFSFGAMFTNSLAQNHQNMLRGVVVYAAADYNIYFPENTGEPLAYMGVHGLDDPTCPLDSGRRSKDRFVANNGCEAPEFVPEAGQNGGYVVYDHECPSSYPVRWATFDGAHTYPPNDVKDSWVHPVAWEFITQF